MLVERIDPDWQWSRYRKVELSRDDGPKLSYSSKYRPTSEAVTLHRSFSKAFADQRFKTTEIKDRQLRRSRRKQFLEHWLTSFGKLTADHDFDEFEFNKEAGFVWWVVQVFDVLRAKNMDPVKVKPYEAFSTMLDVPNPAQVASDGDEFFPFQRAALDSPRAPVTMLDSSGNDHSSYIRRNISRDQETWSVNYSELLEVLGLTISKKLQDGVKLTFESMNRETMPVPKGSDDFKGISVEGFPFLNVPRGRYGTRGGKVENLLDLKHKINMVLQPENLLNYIWMLCAEELTELPDVVFENCKGFEFCGNTIKRPALRPCKYCRLEVSLHSDQTVRDSAPILANVHDVTGDCDKSPTNRHEVRKHNRDWCSKSCQHRNRSK